MKNIRHSVYNSTGSQLVVRIATTFIHSFIGRIIYFALYILTDSFIRCYTTRHGMDCINNSIQIKSPHSIASIPFFLSPSPQHTKPQSDGSKQQITTYNQLTARLSVSILRRTRCRRRHFLILTARVSIWCFSERKRDRRRWHFLIIIRCIMITALCRWQ